MHDDAHSRWPSRRMVSAHARGAVLGMLDYWQAMQTDIAEGIRDRFGELINPKPEPKPILIPRPAAKVATRVEGFALWLKTGQAPACTACGAHAQPTIQRARFGAISVARWMASFLLHPLAVGDICPADGCGLKLVMSGALRCKITDRSHSLRASPRME